MGIEELSRASLKVGRSGPTRHTPAARGRTRCARRSLLVALFTASALLFAAWAAARALIVRAEVAQADVLVVLSGSAVYVERTRFAAQLFAQGRAPMILLTNDNESGGWSSAEQRNPTFSERAVAELMRAGVPRERIRVLAQPVSSTHEEALVLREYATAQGLRSLLVVTSAYHSRRALWTMRRVFQGTGVTIGLQPVPVGDQSPGPWTWWLHLRGWKAVPLEYAKMVYYRWRFAG